MLRQPANRVATRVRATRNKSSWDSIRIILPGEQHNPAQNLNSPSFKFASLPPPKSPACPSFFTGYGMPVFKVEG